MDSQPGRSEYKKVWSALSTTLDQAKLHVIGVTDEEALRATGEETLGFLRETVGINRDDVILEIGCGIGRVGKMVAPLCRKWIGCDVASNMLALAAERLKDMPNVELKEISGYELTGVASASVDVVYCTVVFMHLETWDRYNYILEAFRVLRTNGRIYVDNINLCSDGGWKVFETHRAWPPATRPPHMTQNSTPQEIKTYLWRAGFSEIEVRKDDDWIRASAIKRANNPV
ncbi:MAG TPA: class I SAM-dependent methyltransferase [Candidatus Udaeobacter sp.]|jgi:ubiquinone/menaquinone biosynthesis C-methylase UbiE|nr:class I SAM-dependent methyltransferase [Candidatus Udaeobacter sp.]